MQNNTRRIFGVCAMIALIAIGCGAAISPAMAQQNLNLQPKCNPVLAPGQPGACDVSAAITFIKQAINLMIFIAVPLAALFIVWGGFVMLTAGGDEGQFEKGKGIVKEVAIGVAIAFGAYILVSSILNFFITGSPF